MTTRQAEGTDHRDIPRSASFLGRRIPVWAVLAVIVAVTAVFTVVLLVQRRSAVDLGPAVPVAERIEVHMRLCNEDVDRLDLNPRRAELDVEAVLRREGADIADVTVERRDCPSSALSRHSRSEVPGAAPASIPDRDSGIAHRLRPR